MSSTCELRHSLPAKFTASTNYKKEFLSIKFLSTEDTKDWLVDSRLKRLINSSCTVALGGGAVFTQVRDGPTLGSPGTGTLVFVAVG